MTMAREDLSLNEKRMEGEEEGAVDEEGEVGGDEGIRRRNRQVQLRPRWFLSLIFLRRRYPRRSLNRDQTTGNKIRNIYLLPPV